jgi:MFS family permease
VHNGEHPPLSRRPAHASGPGRHRQPGDHPVAYRDVFAVREFRALWSAQALSCAGDQFAQVAIAFVVYSRTHSAFLTAAAYALTYLPPVIGGPVLSGLADLIPRQQLMITLDLIRAGLVALMALRGLPFAGLCALFFCTVLLGTPFPAARSALLPDVLTVDKYPLGLVIGSHTTQLSQIAGFLAGGGLIAALGPYRALALDSLSFSLSAGILACAVRPRPVPPRSPAHSSPWEITWEGMAAVFGSPALRTLVLFGWLAGFTVVPEALAAPYAHILGGGAPAIGLLMAAMPAGTVIGGFVIGRLLRPSDRMRPMGWLAMLSCAPLIFSLAHPPLAVLVLLWSLAGAGGAYQLAAAAAFVSALPAARRVRAFAVAQTGLLAAQGLGILTGGAVAQRIGAPGAVALAGLLGLLAASALATDWTRRYTELLSMLSGGQVTAALAGTGSAAPAQPPAPQPPALQAPASQAPAPPTPAPLPARPPRPAIAAEPRPSPPKPPVLNLPVAERGTGLSALPPLPAPPPPDAPPLVVAAVPAPPSAAGHGSLAESAPAGETSAPAGQADHTLGTSPAPEPDRAPGKGTHRGPARRAPRDLSVRAWLAATRLLDQVLGDRRALPFLWDEDPRRQVYQHEDADRHQAQGDENQPDHGGVDADVLTDPGADASHEPTFPCPD